MNRIPLQAEERIILGKKVKNLRKTGIIPAHVYGNKIETEHVSVPEKEFKKVYHLAGETGLIDLKIGTEKIRPVLVRGVQVHPVNDNLLHIDFYQVNLTQKVTVPVPIEIFGEEPDLVKAGEAVVIQPMSEVQVEALPTELPEKITVDISTLKQIGDATLISQLKVSEGVTILADVEAVVVKLDTAITEEMKKLMEEEAAAQAAVQAQVVIEGAPQEGEATAEGEEAKEEPTGETATKEKSTEEAK